MAKIQQRPQEGKSQKEKQMQEQQKKITNAKPIPHIPLPFKEVMADVLKVKPPRKSEASVSEDEPKEVSPADETGGPEKGGSYILGW